MIHARPDYNRIQDPALGCSALLAPGCSAIAADEPVFLLRAGDSTAADTLRFWADRNAQLHGDPKAIEMARQHARLMDAWPKKKLADVPK